MWHLSPTTYLIKVTSLLELSQLVKYCVIWHSGDITCFETFPNNIFSSRRCRVTFGAYSMFWHGAFELGNLFSLKLCHNSFCLSEFPLSLQCQYLWEKVSDIPIVLKLCSPPLIHATLRWHVPPVTRNPWSWNWGQCKVCYCIVYTLMNVTM